MSRDKQIDSMAKDLCHTETCEIKKIGIPCNHRCKAHIYATRAIDKGYRRATEVAEEIFAEIERTLDNYHSACCPIGEIETYSYYEGGLGKAIAELKRNTRKRE